MSHGLAWGDWFTMCSAHPLDVCMLNHGLLIPLGAPLNPCSNASQPSRDSFAMGLSPFILGSLLRGVGVTTLLCRPKWGADSGIYFSGRTFAPTRLRGVPLAITTNNAVEFFSPYLVDLLCHTAA